MPRNKSKDILSKEKKLINEYTGTGASGGNAGDGNNQTSRRRFPDTESEMRFYKHQNVYGSDGEQWTGDKASYPNANRDRRGGMFEQGIGSDDYGDATLTTQGNSIHRAPGVWEWKQLKHFQERFQQLQTVKEQQGGGSAEDEAYQRKLISLHKAVI